MVLEDFFFTSEALEEPDPMTCTMEQGEMIILLSKPWILSGSKGFDSEINHSHYLDALDRRVDGEDLELLDDDGGDAAGAVRRLGVDRLYHSPVRRPLNYICI